MGRGGEGERGRGEVGRGCGVRGEGGDRGWEGREGDGGGEREWICVKKRGMKIDRIAMRA